MHFCVLQRYSSIIWCWLEHFKIHGSIYKFKKMKPLKKLEPLFESRKLQLKPTVKDETKNQLQTCIESLTSQMSLLFQRVCDQDAAKRTQKRFQDIACSPPILDTKNAFSRQLEIKKWFGASCKEIFSIGFALFEKGELDHKKLNVYCSQNILRHTLLLSEVNKLESSDFQFLNGFLKEELLPYFLLKYPLSEQSQTSVGFSRKLVEKDNKLSNSNDLIYRSKIKFQWREDENYNGKIMEFFNYLLELPDSKINEVTNLTDLFFKDMEEIFTSVEKEDNMLIMKMYEPEHPEKYVKIESEPVSKETMKQEEKYREKVRSYTDYKIGRKLSQNIPKFGQNQIKSSNLRIKSSAVMRVMTKWCDELEECFEPSYILKRQHQFRMKDGSTKFLKKDHQIILSKLLQRQWKIIQKYLSSLQKNNYQHQSMFSKLPLNNNYVGFSKEEGSVGQFSSKIFRNNENYLIGHLNSLLHGILTASKDFDQIIRVQKQNNWQTDQLILDLIEYDKEITDVVNKSNISEVDKNIDVSAEVPELITFLIGDLLRCKCSSHQNQIIAIYNQIERLSQMEGQHLQIVRLKNRLESGTKDILMNIMYRDTLVIQMQLAIKTDKSKFLDCSTHFNHYLYELKRAEFGPLSELASIWINLDLRGGFYLQKLQELDERVKTDIQIQECCKVSQNLKDIKLPFKCTICNFHYSECNFIEDHIKCQSCKTQRCLNCRLDNLNYSQARKILTFLPQMQETYSIEICKEIPSEGLLVNLKSQEKKAYFFKRIIKDKKKFIFVEDDQNKKLTIMNIIKGKKQEKRFLREYFILNSLNFHQNIPQISEQQANHRFFIPSYLEKCAKIQKDSISIVKERVNDELFSSCIDQKVVWPKVTKINFSENQFENSQNFFQRFKNVETAVLNLNSINMLGPHIKNWKKVRELHLVNNSIASIDAAIGECTELTIVDLEHNKLEYMPDQFCHLVNIQKLNLNGNKLIKLPQEIGQLIWVEELNLGNNMIQHLPETFGKMRSLVYLAIQNNQLKSLSQNFGELKKLQKAIFFENQLKQLPQTFGNLSSLTSLNLQGNQLEKLCENFGSLKKLSEINAAYNEINQLPQSFGQLESLERCDFFKNNIQLLPKDLGGLKKLRQANFWKNKIQLIPDSIGQLQRLEQIAFSMNQIQEFPFNITKLTNLIALGLDSNKIKTIPEEIAKMKKLKSLDLNKNYLEKIPASLLQLQELEYLGLSNASVEDNQFPSFLLKLPNIKILSLKSIPFNSLPEEIAQMDRLNALQVDVHLLNNQSQQIMRQLKAKILARKKRQREAGKT